MSGEPQKLLLVTDAWHPQVNGVVTVFSALVRTLERRGWKVLVVHPEMFRTVPFPLYPEVPLAFFPKKKVEEIFRTFKPDYVHIAVEWTLGRSARTYCLKRGIPFTTSYHTNFRLYAAHYFPWIAAPAGWLADRYMRWFHRKAHRTLVSNATLESELAECGYEHLAVWPFGVDTERFTRMAHPRVGTNLEHPVFVYFGRIGKEKSIDEFLEAKLPGTKLVIGDGPYRASLERRYGHAATFIGYQKGPDLVEWLSVCDVSVFPSRTETFGMTILEALSCGIPVAGHDVIGPRDVITNGVDGFISDDLADAARRCLTLSREACRKTALRHSWDRSADEFISHQVQVRY
jgi:glycosyltransferase involved in cell wall biosynthesis